MSELNAHGSQDQLYERIQVEIPDRGTIQVVLSHSDIKRLESGDKEMIQKIESEMDRSNPADKQLTNKSEPETSSSVEPLTRETAKQSSWSLDATQLLIQLYGDTFGQFKTATSTKHGLFDLISDELANQGYVYSAKECSAKIRMLKHRYKSIVESEGRMAGPIKTKWMFFNDLHKLFGESLELGEVSADVDFTVSSDDVTDCKLIDIDDYYKTALPYDENLGDSNTWNYNTIMLLLSLYAAQQQRILTPGVNKRAVWKDIAMDMSKLGYTFDEDAISTKLRNLRHRYKILQGKPKESRQQWEFYAAIDTILQREMYSHKVKPHASKPSRLAAPFSGSNKGVAKRSAAEAQLDETDVPPSQPQWFADFAWDHARTMRKLIDFNDRTLKAIEKQNELLVNLVATVKSALDKTSNQAGSVGTTIT